MPVDAKPETMPIAIAVRMSVAGVISGDTYRATTPRIAPIEPQMTGSHLLSRAVALIASAMR